VIAAARVPREPGERLLEEFAAAGWAARVVGDRWMLACDPDAVTIAQVYERLVFASPGAAQGADAVLDGVMTRAAAGAGGAIGAPLRALAGEAPAGEEPKSPPKRQGRQEDLAPLTVGGTVED
jgi:hypothetical protein